MTGLTETTLEVESGTSDVDLLDNVGELHRDELMANWQLVMTWQRIPPEVHRNLAIRAAESGISINRVVSSKLSQ